MQLSDLHSFILSNNYVNNLIQLCLNIVYLHINVIYSFNSALLLFLFEFLIIQCDAQKKLIKEL